MRGRFVLAALATSFALVAGGAAHAGTFAATVTWTAKTARPGTAPAPRVVCGSESCGGGGGVVACGSAWADKHEDTITGSYGFHGQVSFCWSATSVWDVSLPISAWSNNRYSVLYDDAWPAGADCAGGAGRFNNASFRWEPLPNVFTNFTYTAHTFVCPGGWGVIR